MIAVYAESVSNKIKLKYCQKNIKPSIEKGQSDRNDPKKKQIEKNKRKTGVKIDKRNNKLHHNNKCLCAHTYH